MLRIEDFQVYVSTKGNIVLKQVDPYQEHTIALQPIQIPLVIEMINRVLAEINTED